MTKTSLQETSKDKEDTFILKEQNRHVLFCGTKVIQARTHDKDKVRVVVIRTGKGFNMIFYVNNSLVYICASNICS